MDGARRLVLALGSGDKALARLALVMQKASMHLKINKW
jgi:hypothetical protein